MMGEKVVEAEGVSRAGSGTGGSGTLGSVTRAAAVFRPIKRSIVA